MLAKLLHLERRAAAQDEHIVTRVKGPLSLAKSSIRIVTEVPIERRGLTRAAMIDKPTAESPRGGKIHHVTIGVHHAMKE